MWTIKKIVCHDFRKKNLKQLLIIVNINLYQVYSQNASLEISKTEVLKKYKTITGKKIMPFFSNDLEGTDINYKEIL